MDTKIFRDWRILLYIILLIVSVILILPTGKTGAVVQKVDVDSPLYGKVSVGESIDSVNEKYISSPTDLTEFENFIGTLRLMHSGKLEIINIETPGLKIKISEPDKGRLKFGMDLVGGTRVLLEPEGNVSEPEVQQILGTLQTRINVFGLKESKFQAVKDVGGKSYVQIETSGALSDIEGLLAKQGNFEGKISKTLRFSGNETKLLNETLTLSNNSIFIGGGAYSVNESFALGGINFEIVNITENSAYVFADVFESADIKSVCIQEQQGFCISRVVRTKGGWEFNFQVFITKDAAEKFAKATKDSPPSAQNTGYIEDKIILLLDGKVITDLNIANSLAGQAYTEPLITGFRTTKDETVAEKLTLQSILQSGALPVKLNVVRVDQISATLGQGFIFSAATAGFIAALAVSAVIFARYRKMKIVVPVILTTLSEVVIIFGAAALIGWTIDLSSIAGIIATVGTGVDAQIFIIDELLAGASSQALTFKQKLKRAFFMIFGSASTVIAAMLPLMVIGIGVMRGFALTTIMGVLIGIFITRPAFSRIAENILGNEEEKKI
ncbi:MAG TPA: hypothetical protein VI933_00730 [archaeon]|nr:hypothetical protein [archaeon]